MSDTISLEDLEGQFGNRSPAGTPAAVSMDDLEKQYASPTPQPSAPVAPPMAEVQAKAPTPPPINLEDLEKQYDQSKLDPAQFAEAVKPAFLKGKDLDLDMRHSVVGSAVSLLNKPLEAGTAATAYALDKIPGLHGMQAAINPEDKVFPDSSYSDITDFIANKALGTPEEVYQHWLNAGYSPTASRVVSESYRAGRLGLGLAANIYLDPLSVFHVQVGQLTPEAEAAQKAGDYSNTDRMAVTAKIPLSGKEVGISMADLEQAYDKGADHVNALIDSTPGARPVISQAARIGQEAAQKVSDIVKSFDYRTGDPDLDLKTTLNWGRTRGDVADVVDRYVKPYNLANLDETEEQGVARLIESTPNVRPNIDEKILAAAGDKAGIEHDEVKALMTENFDKVTKDILPEITPERRDVMIEQAMAVKRLGAETLESRARMGKLTKDNAAEYILENHLVHKANPAYLRYNSPELAAAKLEDAMKADIAKTTASSTLSRMDKGKFQRTMEGSLEAVNQRMEERTGIKNYFLTNPMAGTTMRYLETRKLERDKELLDFLQNRARFKNDPVAKAQGWERIPHPEFNGEMMKVVDQDGKVLRKEKLEDLVFPKEIASKMSYYMSPKSGNDFAQAIKSYNNIFRTFALASPGYYARNWAENIVKNHVLGAKMEDYVDALKTLMDKNGNVQIGDKLVPMAEIKKAMIERGVFTGGQFREGLDDLMHFGKKTTADLKMYVKSPLNVGAPMMKQHIMDVFRGLRNVGEKGENYTRATLFISKLKQGYNYDTAAREVEKFLFDFTRNSKATDFARTYYKPFIQHAMKTAFVAPELVGMSPATYNFLHNQMLRTIANAFVDPVTQKEVLAIIPEYKQLMDPVAGVFMPGNHWLAAAFGQEKSADKIGSAIILRTSMGLDVLNQLTDPVSGIHPLLKSALILTGHDVSMNRLVDINPSNPSQVNRMNQAIDSAMTSMVQMPNTVKIIKQMLGLGSPQYYEPASVLLMKGSFGQFGQVEDLDKDFTARIAIYASTKKQLIGELASKISQEARGKTLDLALGDKPGLSSIADGANAWSSAKVYAELLNQEGSFEKAKLAAGGLKGEYSTGDIAGMIKNIDQTIKQANQNYQVLKQRYYQIAKEAKNANEAQMRLDQELSQ